MRFFSYFSVLHFSNCYLIGPEGPGEAVLIDAGVFDEGLLRLIEDNGLYIRWILITHCHHGHIHGLQTLQKVYEARIHAFDAEGIEAPVQPLSEGKTVDCGPFSFQVLETPGHSNDSVCFLLDRMLFTGDTLFVGSVGRTDLPGGSSSRLLQSIRETILRLPGDTRVWPGHDYGRTPFSTVAREQESNPFLSA